MFKTILACFFLTLPAWAIELQTKPRNSDKRYFNAMPGVGINEGLRFYTEFNYATNPLVGKGSVSNQIKPLLDSQMEMDLALTYSLGKSFQIGLLVPIESNQETYLGSSVLEAKWNFMPGFAIVPQYYLPSSQVISVDFDGTNMLIPVGAPKGGYGMKLVSEWGDISKSGSIGAFIGYVAMPENIYGTLDQSSRIQMGVSGGIPVTKNSNFILELFGEKTPSNVPMEAQAVFNSYGKSWSYSVGLGSGKLKGSAGNDMKAFVGISYTFGQSKKDNFGAFPTLPSSGRPVDWKKFDTKKGNGTFNEDDIEVNQAPVLEAPKDAPKKFDPNSLDKSEDFLKSEPVQNIDRSNIPEVPPSSAE